MPETETCRRYARGVALLYAAQLSPSKREVIAAWLPSTDYYAGTTPVLEQVGAYRFDDPAGEVGIEIHLVRDADGSVYQVPLTYRGAPLPTRAWWERWSIRCSDTATSTTRRPTRLRPAVARHHRRCRTRSRAVRARRRHGTAEDREHRAHPGHRVRAGDCSDGHRTTDNRCRNGHCDRSGSTTVVVHHRPVDTEPTGSALVGEWDTGRALLAAIR